MYGALKGGAFLSEIQLKSTSTIEDEVKQTSTARILVDILRAQVSEKGTWIDLSNLYSMAKRSPSGLNLSLRFVFRELT